MTESIREYLTPDKRALPLEFTIDPGFVHRRAIETILGQPGMKAIDSCIERLPDLPDWMKRVRTDHIYKDVLIEFCRINKAPTLSDILAMGRGRLFCSVESLEPCPNIYEGKRASSRITPVGDSSLNVVLEYSTEFVYSDTLRSELHTGGTLAVIAILDRKDGDTLYFRPLVIGGPWLRSEDPKWSAEIMWWGQDFFENFIEDFKEFSKVKVTEKPTSLEPMRDISESAFKACLAEILGDTTTKDWGGEQSDHYTAHLHLGERRVTAAFVLKGPAKFSPMKLNHLGKNNDQIYRLAQEPADVLFVQHSHEITPPVRATLRAFSVQPGNARRYCLIDGRDSLWLLNSYGLYEKALQLSSRAAG